MSRRQPEGLNLFITALRLRSERLLFKWLLHRPSQFNTNMPSRQSRNRKVQRASWICQSSESVFSQKLQGVVLFHSSNRSCMFRSFSTCGERESVKLAEHVWHQRSLLIQTSASCHLYKSHQPHNPRSLNGSWDVLIAFEHLQVAGSWCRQTQMVDQRHSSPMWYPWTDGSVH